MANRKLQKDIDIIFKKIAEGLHEFHYHYDRYEAINNDEDSDNQREKEKLESDLKKEIKRLQKFREQIKIWQSKDDIKQLTLTSAQLSQKLNENKRLIEEGMEMYKEVERTSKLKTFSNQSILMAASMDADDDDDAIADGDSDEWDSDQDVEEVLSDPEDDEYSEEIVAEILFFNDIIHQLSAQLQKLHGEHDKLANKKVRKNNSGTIEAKKEKITTTLGQHKIHIKRILKLIRLLKTGRLSDTNLLEVVKSDLEKYVDTNGEFDNNLYDDIFNAVVAEDVDYTAMDETQDDTISEDVTSVVAKSSAAAAPVVPSSPQVGPLSTHSPPHSPAIVKSLRPAATPVKPMGNLKWSAAAVVGLPEVSPSPVSATPEPAADFTVTSSPRTPTTTTTTTTITTTTTDAVVSHPPPNNDINDPNYKYLSVVSHSQLSPAEQNVFSDLNLVKLPTGIQDMVISFTATRKGNDKCNLLRSAPYNPYVVPLSKPYLPAEVQIPVDNGVRQFKPPTQLFKLQAYWHKVRSQNSFEQFTTEVGAMAASQSANEAVVQELTSVLFFGYYYGLTPVENIIAERCLFGLGWRPYRVPASSLPGKQPHQSLEATYFWFQRVQMGSEDDRVELGDYHGFDVSSWEFFFKHNFKMDQGLVQGEPLQKLC